MARVTYGLPNSVRIAGQSYDQQDPSLGLPASENWASRHDRHGIGHQLNFPSLSPHAIRRFRVFEYRIDRRAILNGGAESSTYLTAGSDNIRLDDTSSSILSISISSRTSTATTQLSDLHHPDNSHPMTNETRHWVRAAYSHVCASTHEGNNQVISETYNCLCRDSPEEAGEMSPNSGIACRSGQ